MTPYVPSVDLATAAVRRLKLHAPYRTLVEQGVIGTEAASDSSLTTLTDQSWLFQGLNNDGTPFRDPEGSGRAVVVVSARQDWAVQNRHNTMGFPGLQVLVYADSTRDAEGAPVTYDALPKVKDIFKAINSCFHIVGNRVEDQMWSSLRVHSCVSSSALSIMDVPGTNSTTVRGEKTYDAVTD